MIFLESLDESMDFLPPHIEEIYLKRPYISPILLPIYIYFPNYLDYTTTTLYWETF